MSDLPSADLSKELYDIVIRSGMAASNLPSAEFYQCEKKEENPPYDIMCNFSGPTLEYISPMVV